MSQATNYEITYIIRPNIDEEAKSTLIERFDAILTDNGAEISESKDWEKRRFAYEMEGYNEGIYHIIKVSAASDASAIKEFDRLAKINDDIIRHMIIKLEA